MDKYTLFILELIDDREHVSVSDLDFVLNLPMNASADPLEWLLEKGYIQYVYGTSDMSPEAMFSTTYEGKVYLRNRKASDTRDARKEFRAWMTLAIALAAFIKSFFF